jgi:hypothetical protein
MTAKTLTQKEFQREVRNNFPGWKWTFFGFRAVGKTSKGHRMEWQYSNEGWWDYTREGSATLLVKGEGTSMDEALDFQSTFACSFDEAKLNDPD